MPENPQFCSNTTEITRKRVCELMEMNEAGVGSLYLGLPNMMGRNKSALLGFFGGES